jgi:hypothetical protein
MSDNAKSTSYHVDWAWRTVWARADALATAAAQNGTGYKAAVEGPPREPDRSGWEANLQYFLADTPLLDLDVRMLNTTLCGPDDGDEEVMGTLFAFLVGVHAGVRAQIATDQWSREQHDRAFERSAKQLDQQLDSDSDSS